VKRDIGFLNPHTIPIDILPPSRPSEVTRAQGSLR
jgi:hypothetical protein